MEFPEHPAIDRVLATGYPWTEWPWPKNYYSYDENDASFYQEEDINQ